MSGHYRSVPVAFWSDPGFRALSADAKVVLLALMTGAGSNLAGVAFYYTEALAGETGLAPERVEAALSELARRPSPRRSFIVREAGIVWVKDQLRNDPAREGDPKVQNPKHRVAIQRILASLPRSPIVKKFRKSYGFRSNRVSHRVSPTPTPTLSDSPDTGTRTRYRKPEPPVSFSPSKSSGEPAPNGNHHRPPAAPTQGRKNTEIERLLTRSGSIPKPGPEPLGEVLNRIRAGHPEWAAAEAEGQEGLCR